MKRLIPFLLLLAFHSCSKKESGSVSGPTEVEYQMTHSNAKRLSNVSFHNEDVRLWAEISPLPVNWSRKFVPNRKPFHALLRGSVLANEGEEATLTVTILVNGKVVKTETQTGNYLFVVLEHTVN